MLDKLKLNNFTRFSDLPEIEFSSKINIIIGENGTGKSTIVEAIAEGIVAARRF